MNTLDRYVNRARRRLWLNRWLRQLGWTLVFALVVWIAFIVVERLFHFGIPVLATAGGLAGLAVLAAGIWLVLSAEDPIASAEALDKSANLRERVTSGLYCTGSDDPFAQSVCADAVRTVRDLQVGRHLPILYPRSFNWAAGTLTVSLFVLWLMPSYDLLGKLSRQRRQEQSRQALKTTQVAVQQTVERLKQMTKDPESLKDVKGLEDLGDIKPAENSDPDELRREAVKRVDQLADKLKQQQESARYDPVNELQKMLSRLENDRRPETPVDRLRKGLAESDYKASSEALKEMKEELARAKATQNKDQVKEMQKQLDGLAKQMEKLAKDDRLKEKLRQSGMSEQDAKDMLEHLSKRDLQSLRDELEKRGLDKQQIENLARQLAKSQAAREKCRSLTDKFSNACKSMSGTNDTDLEEAEASLSEAGEELSDLEAQQQELNDLQGKLAELDRCKNGLCKGEGEGEGECAGTGEGEGGKGPGMGGLGEGAGNVAPREEVPFETTPERSKGKQSPGKVLAEFFVDGEQLKGEAKAEYGVTVSAAQREATEAMDRDRIPRQYHRAVKQYFGDIQPAQGTSQPSGKP